MRNLLQGVAVFFERTAAIELRKFELWQQVSVEEGQWTELTTIIKGKENKERVKIEISQIRIIQCLSTRPQPEEHTIFESSILAQAAKNAVRASTATQLVLSVRGVQVLVLVNFLGKETMGLDIFYHERLSNLTDWTLQYCSFTSLTVPSSTIPFELKSLVLVNYATSLSRPELLHFLRHSFTQISHFPHEHLHIDFLKRLQPNVHHSRPVPTAFHL